MKRNQSYKFINDKNKVQEEYNEDNFVIWLRILDKS